MNSIKKELIFLIFILLAFVLEPITYHYIMSQTPPSSKPAEPKKEPTPDEFYNWTKSVIELINQLENISSTERTSAFEKLYQIGQPVIPFLVERLKTKGIYLDLACQIQAHSFNLFDSSKNTAEIIKGLTSQESSVIEKYYYGKYLYALQLFRQEKYQPALELINAILLLEPQIPSKNVLKQFKIKCEEQILQQKIVKATLFIPKEIYELGEQIKLKLTLENLTLAPIEIILGDLNRVFLYLTISEYGPLGDFNSLSRMEEIKLSNASVELTPGQNWETNLLIDTAQDNPRSIYYRVYSINTELRPISVKSLDGETIRKITTPTVFVKVFPPDIKPVLAHPLESLGKALDGGIPIDIFLCALLVPETDREKELTILISALEKSDESTQKVIINCLKHITGLPFEIEPKTWLDWWRSRKKPK